MGTKSPRVPGSQTTSPTKKTLTPSKDQNRNKTVRQTKNHLKHPNQPDLVTNAIGSSRAAEEISRLEALCESRTKELNYIKLQLKQRNTGFESMAILVKYLTQELNAFSCPTVTAQLSDTKEQLIKAKDHLDELTNQRDALIDEIQCLKQQHQDETEKLTSDYKKELTSLEERLKQEKEDAVTEVVDRHSKEVTTLTQYHERSISEAKLENEKAIENKVKEHEEHMCKVQKEQEQQLAELQKKHESQLEEITMRFEHIKVTLSEKVEYLRNECEEMRRREKTYMEACKRDTDRKVQAALAPYKHIQQEIESLRAVMELRNDEIHELRRQKLELEKQLEELPVARDQITRLKQKVENLEAIQEIKTDYERQLAEKHQVLLRKFDRESKANKRLSMDNEELAWRLNQSDAGSPDLLRRSISHSPTHSDVGTPEPGKPRRKSPLPPHSPRSPNGMSKSAEFNRSPCTTPREEKRKSAGSNLRRSGTYDLLDKEFTDEDKMSESDV